MRTSSSLSARASTSLLTFSASTAVVVRALKKARRPGPSMGKPAVLGRSSSGNGSPSRAAAGSAVQVSRAVIAKEKRMTLRSLLIQASGGLTPPARRGSAALGLVGLHVAVQVAHSLAGAVQLRHLARGGAAHQDVAVGQARREVRLADRPLPDGLALAVQLHDLARPQVAEKDAASRQDPRLHLVARRVARHLVTLQLAPLPVDAVVGAVVDVADEGDGAVAQPAAAQDVVGVARDVVALLALAVHLQDAVAADDERVAVLETLGDDRLGDALLLPLDVALEVALADAVEVLLGDQDAVAEDPGVGRPG